jgi:transposase
MDAMDEKPITSNDFEKRILDLLSAKLLSVSQIAKMLGVRRDVICGYLEALKNQGKLEFHKVGRSNVYTVSKVKK